MAPQGRPPGTRAGARIRRLNPIQLKTCVCAGLPPSPRGEVERTRLHRPLREQQRRATQNQGRIGIPRRVTVNIAVRVKSPRGASDRDVTHSTISSESGPTREGRISQMWCGTEGSEEPCIRAQQREEDACYCNVSQMMSQIVHDQRKMTLPN